MFCKKCGNSLPDGAVFCNKCAHKVFGEESSKAGANDKDSHGSSLFSDLVVASAGTRLVNFIVDRILSIVFMFVFCVILATIYSAVAFIFQPIAYVIWFAGVIFAMLMLPGYYIFFESIWQRTPAKFLTKTKVVMRNGSKPDFKHILGRSLCRFIPYEFLTFLRSNPAGWHDRFSGTLVVPNSYTPEDVKKIKLKSKSKWDNVIIVILVLLVSVVIIAVLASIVLVNVTGYINKAKDATIESDISTIMVNAMTYYDTNQNYNGFWDTEQYNSYSSDIKKNNGGNIVVGNFGDYDGHLCVCSNLEGVSSDTYCADDLGYKKETATTCPVRCGYLGSCSD